MTAGFGAIEPVPFPSPQAGSSELQSLSKNASRVSTLVIVFGGVRVELAFGGGGWRVSNRGRRDVCVSQP